MACSDSFTILGLWVLGLAVSNINESQLQTYESKTLFLMTSLQYYCILGLPEIKTYAQKMQDAQVTKSLGMYMAALIRPLDVKKIEPIMFYEGIKMPSFQAQYHLRHRVSCNRHALVPSSIPYQYMQCMQARREMCVIL